jgi:hypothetical protein
MLGPQGRLDLGRAFVDAALPATASQRRRDLRPGQSSS